MKRLVIISSGLILMSIYACNSGSGTASGKDSSAPSSADSGTTLKPDSAAAPMASASNPDSDFLRGAATGGLAEVEMGNVASQNGSSSSVKDFGSLMVKDHSMGGDQLRALAASKGFILPDSVTDKQQHERTHLLSKTGSDFDKDYVKMMVEDHKDDIKDFEKEVKDGKDADVKAFAQKTLPMLHSHLDKIEAIQKSM